MKYFLSIAAIAVMILSCESSKSSLKNDSSSTKTQTDTLRIANDSLEYEILIVEPGFYAWLDTQPPMTFHGIDYLESRNHRYVLTYNNRVYNPSYSKLLYPLEINYDATLHYGLEVNYLLYNYFLFFEQKYNQKLR